MKLSKIVMSESKLDPETFTMRREIVITINPEAMSEEFAQKSPDVVIGELVKEYEKFLRDMRAQQVKQLQKS